MNELLRRNALSGGASSRRSSTTRSTSSARSFGGAAYLANQDLHGANLLQAEREPWLVIDPKPLVGEPELDAVGLRCAVWRGQSLIHWLDVLTALGLDRERMRGWGVAHALAWWTRTRPLVGRELAAARAILAA